MKYLIVLYLLMFCFVILAFGDTIVNDSIQPCEAPYFEKDGLVVIEAESAQLNSNWTIKTSQIGFLEDGYIMYKGSDEMGSPNQSKKLEYRIKINKIGTYRFKWYSRNGEGASAPDQKNDSWLMIDADDFYGIKDGKKIECKNHFIKVWVQSMNSWSWNCYGEHGVNGFDIYARFDTVGIYNMYIAGRSSGHPIDRMILFDSSISVADAQKSTNEPTQCGITINYSLNINRSSLILEINTSKQLEFDAFLPKEDKVIWSSKDTSIVTVSSKGMVKALGSGETYVYANAENNSEYADSCKVTVNAITSVNRLNQEPFCTVYPNPGSDIVNFDFDAFYCFNVELVDLSGQVIHTENMKYKSNSYSIDIASLNIHLGVYLIRIIADEKIQVVKFVKN